MGPYNIKCHYYPHFISEKLRHIKIKVRIVKNIP